MGLNGQRHAAHPVLRLAEFDTDKAQEGGIIIVGQFGSSYQLSLLRCWPGAACVFRYNSLATLFWDWFLDP